MSAKIILKVTQGKLQGTEFSFDEHDTFIFGRLDDCTACLPGDNLVSRHHFLLEANPPDARLRDLGSKNGTYVNGKKYGGREQNETPEEGARRQYPQVDLRDGDEIRAGETVLCFNVCRALECIECGTEIAEQDRARCTWVGGTYLCMKCQALLTAQEKQKPPAVNANAEAGKPKIKPPEPARCQQCGKDVLAEIGPNRRGDYVCEACRQKAVADPLALLMELLKQAQQESEPALKIPEYDLEKKLGEGGMGAVYLVRHKKKGTRAALKVMLSKVAVDERARATFLREMEVTRSLRHKNIVEFFDHGATGGVFYFLLEFCDGGSVDRLMAAHGGRIPLDVAKPIMLQALEGLAFLHDKDYVHRDLKPQNILLTGSGRSCTAKVADMGLAKNFTRAGFSGMTATGSFGGTFPFMPREQVTNFKYYKPVSDVWAIGATFYNMLTGDYPRNFLRGQDPMEVILHGEVVPLRKRLSSFPKSVAEVIDRALVNKAGDRYQSAGEMRKALEKVL